MQFRRVIKQVKNTYTTGMFHVSRTDTLLMCEDNPLSYTMAKQLAIVMCKCHLVHQQYNVSIGDYREQFHKIGLDIEDHVLVNLINEGFSPILCRIATKNGVFRVIMNNGQYVMDNGKLKSRYSLFYKIEKNTVNTKTVKKSSNNEKTIKKINKELEFRKQGRRYNWDFEYYIMKSKANRKFYDTITTYEINEYHTSYNEVRRIKSILGQYPNQHIELQDTVIGDKHRMVDNKFHELFRKYYITTKYN